MVTLIGWAGCPKTKKMRVWLKDHMVNYEEISLTSLLLDTDALIDFLKKIDKAALIKADPSLFEEGREEELAALVQKEPSRIRRPILFLDESFINNSWMKEQMEEAVKTPYFLYCPSSCLVYDLCAGARSDNECAVMQDARKKFGSMRKTVGYHL